jgi:hypothetical protein
MNALFLVYFWVFITVVFAANEEAPSGNIHVDSLAGSSKKVIRPIEMDVKEFFKSGRKVFAPIGVHQDVDQILKELKQNPNDQTRK